MSHREWDLGCIEFHKNFESQHEILFKNLRGVGEGEGADIVCSLVEKLIVISRLDILLKNKNKI